MKKACFLSTVLAISTLAGFAADDVIKVGVIAEITGDMPAVGASCRNAAQMAVDEINQAGGIEVDGKKLKIALSIEDNAGKADQSAMAAQKLITQDKVVAIIGPNASRYTIPAAEVAESEKTLLITPWATNPKPTLDARRGKPKRFVYRACFTDAFQGRVVAKFAQANLKAKKAAILYDVASEAQKGQSDFFKKSFEEFGGKIVACETYTTGDKDFSAQLTKIKSTEPDVIFLPNYYTDVPLQVQQAHKLGITVPFLGSDAWDSQDLLKLGGKDLEGYYFSTHYAPDMGTPQANTFIKKYQERFNAIPDAVAALTYDAFSLLATAVKKAGKVERVAIRNALSTVTDFEGVTGAMRFSPDSGDPVKSAVMLQIKDGKFIWFANVTP